MSSAAHFDFGISESVLEEQRVLAAREQAHQWADLFWGHFRLKIDDVDLGNIEPALSATTSLISAVNMLVFNGKDRELVGFLHSAHYIGLQINGADDLLTLSCTHRMEEVFDSPFLRSKPVPLRAFATALYGCHVNLCDYAVRIYPGQFTRSKRSAIPYSDHLA